MVESKRGSAVDEIEALIEGEVITAERAHQIAGQFPALADCIVGWIEVAAAAGDWHRVVRLANLAAPLRPSGLGRVLRQLLNLCAADLNKEDLVEILGEIGTVEAAVDIYRLVERSVESDAPAYWLCQKAMLSLSDLGTDEARSYLRAMTTREWPDPIRWHAAVALCVEDELGFEEDDMLG